MKKKLLFGVILFTTLFVSILSFTIQSKAVNLNDPDLELSASEQKDILAAYDLDKNGMLQARDVSLMMKKNYSNEEIDLVQRCLVYDMQFSWSYKSVYSLSNLFKSMENNKVLYVELSTKEQKIVAHLQTTDNLHDFIVVTYKYGILSIY